MCQKTEKREDCWPETRATEDPRSSESRYGMPGFVMMLKPQIFSIFFQRCVLSWSSTLISSSAALSPAECICWTQQTRETGTLTAELQCAYRQRERQTDRQADRHDRQTDNSLHLTLIILLSVSSSDAVCATRNDPRNFPFCFRIFSHWTWQIQQIACHSIQTTNTTNTTAYKQRIKSNQHWQSNV